MPDTARMELVLLAQAATIYQQALEDLGFRVLSVDDCSKALHVVQGHAFDVAVIENHCADLAVFLGNLRRTDAALQVIVLGEPPASDLTSERSVEWVGQSIPWSDLNRLIYKSAQLTRLQRENLRLRGLLQTSLGVQAEQINGVPSWTSSKVMESRPLVGGAVDLETINRAHVLAVLAQHQGNKARTARALGINRRSLYRLLEKYDNNKVAQSAENVPTGSSLSIGSTTIKVNMH